MSLLEGTRSKSAGNSLRKTARWVGGTLAVFMACFPLFSQTNQGSIQGGVFDQTGGAIVAAMVTITDISRGVTQALITDSAGQYVANNLTPGTYTVRGEAKGFRPIEHTGVLVEVGRNVRVDLELQPGEQTQTITVTGEVPAIDTTDATLGGTVSNEAINSLPLNGRNFERLLQLRPGVIQTVGGTTGNSSTNGRRPGYDLLLVEGIVQIGESGTGALMNAGYRVGDASSILPIDAIQEFNTEQNPKAEYGWRDGSVVNVGVKSGTNSLHGTAYAFGRNASATDASNFFTHIVTPATLEQFGASAGGRILKDKLFWFANYEGLRFALGSTSVFTVPSDIALSAAADPKNNLSMVNACTDLNNKTLAISALSAQLAGLNPGTCVVTQASPAVENVFPFNPTASNNFAPNLTSSGPLNNGVIKGDYIPGPHHHISGMYYASKADQISASAQLEPEWDLVVPLWLQMEEGSWTWTPNSTWVNEFRGGLSYLIWSTLHADANLLPSNPWPNGYSMPTGVTNPLYGGFPQITFTGLSLSLGGGNHSEVRGPEGAADFVDNVSYLHGNHAFKFGFEFVDVLADSNTYQNSQGAMKFGSLENFLRGIPANGSILEGDPTQVARWHWFSGFAQDDWRLTPKLTLNLGLRYEYIAAPTERNGYLGNFNPDVNPSTTPAIYQCCGPNLPPLYHADRDDFSPRLGVAWDFRGNGKTVVRAGASVLKMPMGGNLVILNSPFGANYPDIGVNNSGTAANAHTPEVFQLVQGQFRWDTTGPIFPVNSGGITCSAALPCSTSAVSPDLRQPGSVQWNLDVQQAITNNLTVDVAYVGVHGFDEQYLTDLNQPAFAGGYTTAFTAAEATAAEQANNVKAGTYAGAVGLTSNQFCLATGTCGVVNPGGEVGPYTPKFPYLNYVVESTNGAHSNYDALQITMQARNYHGLSLLSGYTYAHALDNAINNIMPANNGNLSAGYYGNGANDIRHRFTFSPTYLIPSRKSPGEMLEGWSVNGILTLQTGMPWSPFDQNNDFTGTGEINASSKTGANGIAQPWNYTGPRSAFQVTAAPIPCFGNLSGCTPYAQVGGVPPAACMSAAQANGPLAVASLLNFGCYVQNGGVLTPPAYGTTGNASKGIFFGQSYKNVDFSVSKLWKFRERYSAQFRVEFFNILNRTNFAAPGTDPSKGLSGGFGYAKNTPDSANPVLGSGGPRHIQFGLKLAF